MKRRIVLGLLGAALLPTGRAGAFTRVSDPDRDTLVAGNNEFALDLYARLQATQGNVFYSPYFLCQRPRQSSVPIIHSSSSSATTGAAASCSPVA
jgi:hypothetical protein